MEISCIAASKINLFLRVDGCRQDGYHLLTTLFVPLRWPADCIRVDFNSGSGIALTSDCPGLPDGTKNLAGRAAGLYAEAAGIAPTWRFHIEKRIPVAAGMGGGSSDAAAVLQILNRRYNALPEEKLHSIALRLGADVPFFLHPVARISGGIGDKPLRRVSVKKSAFRLLAVYPKFPVSAGWAFRQMLPPSCSDGPELLADALENGDTAGIAGLLHNDLAPALYLKFPWLTILRDTLKEYGALNAEITGSGSVVYAVFADESDRMSAAGRLRKIFSDSVNILDKIELL